MTTRVFAPALLATLVSGLVLTFSAAGQTLDRACGTNPPPRDLQTVFSFDRPTGRFPEGIAISKAGDIYLGVQATGEIVRLEPQGHAIVADLDQGNGFMLGLAVDAAGVLYAALDSFDPATHGVWQIDPRGTARLIAPMPLSSLANGLAFDLQENLYITDTFLGAVWRLSRSGQLEIWSADPLLQGTGELLGIAAGANGLALFRGSVYVANFDRGTIVRIPILKDGSAGIPTVFAQADTLVSADGIQFDVRGNLYVAVNLQNSLVRVDRCGQVEAIVHGLDRPASLAFDTRGRKLLYVTNFAFESGEHLVGIDVGTGGLPVP